MKKTIYSDQDFKRLIEDNCYYVDKTKVIEELILNKKNGTALFPRPRRFGKSLFMSTLDYFFNVEKNSKHLFKGLYIEKSKVFKEYLNKYPVIHLDFKDLSDTNYDSFYYSFKSLMSKTYNSKMYVYESLNKNMQDKFDRILNESGSVDDYKSSLVNLSEWLYSYYNKEVIILLDEYDAPINAAYVNRYYEKLMELFRPIFSRTFKGNSSLKLGIMTGVLRIGGESFFSAFNNPDIYDVMNSKYNDYFGFTKSETKEMLEYFDLEYSSEVSEYYDGYNFNGVHVYNPWSIGCYVKSKELKPYWINTGSNLLLKDLLSNIDNDYKVQIERLILGGNLRFNYSPKLSYVELNASSFEAILNLMLVSGYLTLDYIDKETNETYYRVPNIEVRNDLAKIISDITFNGGYVELEEARSFVKCLQDGDKLGAEEHLNMVLECVSHRDNKEAFYHGYTLCLFDLVMKDLNNKIYSNRESGYGIPDVIIKNKKKSLGIVVEFKVSKKVKDMEDVSKEGLKQIKDKHYKEELEQDKIKTIYEYVVVFHGKKAIVR